jgi:cyclic pyranopterin phosphate synthase
MDLTWIEVMPMGDLESGERIGQYWSLNELRQTLKEEYTLTDMAERSGGPARYVKVNETGQKNWIYYTFVT